MEGEVRRIHIVYFLSRKGRIEHPHLVRVHHFSQNGVHLHDVKRWLSELRGKDMPESFAWSYKRRYRTGYVWQDLVDEDLITPISDNEYVLKGSEIPSSSNNNISIDVHAEKRAYIQEESSAEEENGVELQNSSSVEDTQQQPQTIYISPKTSPIFSPEASPLTENSINLEEEKLLETTNKKEEIANEPLVDERSDNNSSSFNSTHDSNENKEKSTKKEKNAKDKLVKLSKSDSSSSSKPKYSSINKLMSIFNCRAVETKDSAVVKIKKGECDKKKYCAINIRTNVLQNENSLHSIDTTEIYKGSERSLGNSTWNQQRCPSARRNCDGVKRSSSTKSQSSPKPHRPFNGPNCSQCGKKFKPEKMHKHMRSCSGRRSFGKGSNVNAAATNNNNSDQDLSSRSMDYSTSRESLSGYYLNYRDRE